MPNENPKSECHGGGTFQFAQDVVEKFNGSDKTYPVTKWIQEIEDNQQIFEWSAVQTLLVARRSLIGTAALWLKTERTFKTWEELKTAISKEFPDILDVKAVHEMMAARTKRENESCLDYMLVMKEMGKRGKMPDYVAIQYIVDGIKDAETRKMMLYGVTTYGDFKEKLKIYELLRSKIKSSSAHRDHHDRRDQHREHKTVTTAAGKSTTTLRCYSCGERDHASLDCPHKEKGLKCFKCNEFGHISPECPRHQVRKHNDGKGGGGKPKRTMFGAVNDEQDSSLTVCDKMVYDDNVSRSSLTSDGEEVMQIQNKDVNCGIQQTKTSLKPIKEIKVNGKYADALIDTGSEVNLIGLIDSGLEVNLINVDFCNEPKTAKTEDEKYIEGYATIAKPLTDLLKKDKGFIFEDEQREAFNILKKKLATGPVLKIYDPMLPTELHTDASSIANAAILLQQHPDGGLHPVNYMSRRTNDAQSKYSNYELEALAIIEAVKKFRHYLFGKHFKIFTDCKAFEMTLRKRDNTRVSRWVLLLNEYDYEVHNRSEVLKRIHGNGYFSKVKMKELLNKEYYIQDVDKKIEDFIISL